MTLLFVLVLYLLVGLIISVFSVIFFEKISVIKLSSDEKIEIKSERPFSIVKLSKRFLIFLTYSDSEISNSDKIIFQSDEASTSLIMMLLWPVSVVIIGFMAFGAILGNKFLHKVIYLINFFCGA